MGVVGAGFMGASIAYVTAAAGIPVTLIDRDIEAATKGKARRARASVKDSIGKGRLTQDEGASLLARITPSADYADLKDADLVIEAVFEDREVKKAVIEAVEAVLPKGAIFASNTSTLPIIGPCQELQAPDRFHRRAFLLAGREDDADRSHSRQGDRRQGAGRRARLRCRQSRKRRSSSTTRAASSSTAASSRYIHEAYDMLIEGVPRRHDRECRPRWPACRSVRCR